MLKIPQISKGMKSSIAFFLANVITTGIAYITTPFFTRLLSTEEFGHVSLYLTWEKVFGIIAMFCLSYGIFNNGMSDYPEKRDEFSFSMLILSNLITLIFSVLLLVSYPFLKRYISLDYPLIILMLLIFFFQPAYRFWTVRQRYEYKYKLTSLFTIISALLSPIISILCIYYSKSNKVYARLFGSEVVLLCIYICFYYYLAKQSNFKCDTSYWKSALQFNLPLIPHYLSTYILASSDKIMISNLCGDSDTALYSIAYSVASVGTIVWSAANASLIPFTYERCKVKDYKSISDVTIPILIIYGVVCFLVILLAPELIAILGTSEYIKAIYVVPPVMAGIFFQVQYYMYANVIYYYKKPKYVMIASVSSTIINLILNYVFIKQYGYIAAGYTTLLCYLIQAVIDYFSMKKIVNESVYNMKIVSVLSVLMILICFIGSLLYKFMFIRFAVLVITVIISLAFRKRIFSAFSALKKG